jgi:DNA-binding NarL/FixJ family response regulator
MFLMTGRTAVLFDRSSLWLHCLDRALSDLGAKVCGRTTSALEAVALAAKQRPDLLIAGTDGSRGDLVCIRRARSKVRDLNVVVWSNLDDPRHVEAAFEAGAAAYVLKTSGIEEIVLAIRQTFQPSIYLRANHRPSERGTHAAGDSAQLLTRREVEILQLVAEGSPNAQVAGMLRVTEQTVKFHLSNIYRKLDVTNRTEASRWAQVHGLLAPVATAITTAVS